MSWRKSVIQVALGQKSADLVIRRGRLVNVNTREIYPADIAMIDGRIAIIGDIERAVGADTQVIDAAGAYLVPGLMDSHLHTEDSQVTLTELSKVLLPRGVTAVMYAYEIANVLGVRGTDLIREESKVVPLKVFIQSPTSVPWCQGLETTGTTLSLRDIEEMLAWEETVSLGESDVFDILNLDDLILSKLDAAHSVGKPVNGHAAMVTGDRLMAVAAGAFHDDHENYTAEEVLTKVRLGMRVILREFNLPYVATAITENEIDTRNMLLAIDDKPIHWMVKEGGVDQAVRVAIANGIDPMTAIQMATINPATYFRLDLNLGSISPGRIADLFLTETLEDLQAKTVIVDGKVVARDGQFLLKLPAYHYPEWAKNTVKLSKPIVPSDFEIKTGSRDEVEVRVIVLKEAGFVRVLESRMLPVENGCIELGEDSLWNYIAVVDRHSGDGNIGLGILEGFGIRRGAIATSVGHDCHNLTVVGNNRNDMAVCINALADTGGGYVAVRDGQVLALVPLEIAGLTTEAPYEQVVDQLNLFESICREELGFPENIMFLMITAFVFEGTPFGIAITDKGLVDGYEQKIIPLFI
ncbi:MAG: amidohydrolase family protein [Anaerolineales bacterium]|nr:amidohydrolase family protein [Anaerolineales bacterium]